MYTSTFHEFTTKIPLDYDFMKTEVEPHSKALCEPYEVTWFYSPGGFVMYSRANPKRFLEPITNLLRHTLAPKGGNKDVTPKILKFLISIKFTRINLE